ncbi:MAG: hypothetical protein H0U20_06455 [Thermoleophilaceae bacterium]|nr:hypothetical protein [Thermoleophilaceae bacterium]
MRLKAVSLNCTIKKSPEVSNTQALMDRVIEVLEGLDADCETVRVVDHDVRFGVSSDEGDGDEWPPISRRSSARTSGHRHADLVRRALERLPDGDRAPRRTYNDTNDAGQYPLYNTVGGVVVTGAVP